MPKMSKIAAKEKKIANQLVFVGLILLIIASYLTLSQQLSRQARQEQERLSELQKIEKQVLPLVTQEALQRADLNDDGKIDQADAQIIKDAFLATDAKSLRADLNNDHRVDPKDYSLFVQIFKLKAK